MRPLAFKKKIFVEHVPDNRKLILAHASFAPGCTGNLQKLRQVQKAQGMTNRIKLKETSSGFPGLHFNPFVSLMFLMFSKQEISNKRNVTCKIECEISVFSVQKKICCELDLSIYRNVVRLHLPWSRPHPLLPLRLQVLLAFVVSGSVQGGFEDARLPPFCRALQCSEDGESAMETTPRNQLWLSLMSSIALLSLLRALLKSVQSKHCFSKQKTITD